MAGPDLPPMRALLDNVRSALNVGTMLQRRVSDEPLVNVDYDARVATGLARPDFFNLRASPWMLSSRIPSSPTRM